MKKILLCIHFKTKQDGKGREKEKVKIIVPFRSYTTRNRKFQNNSKKIQKIKKIPLWLHFKSKLIVIKIIVPFRSIPTRPVIEKSKKIAKKFKKLNNIIVASFQAKIGW